MFFVKLNCFWKKVRCEKIIAEKVVNRISHYEQEKGKDKKKIMSQIKCLMKTNTD